MRRLASTALFVLLAAGCGSGEATMEGTSYGEPLTLTQVTPISEITDAPESFVGERVLVEGMVVDVCDVRGCWMEIAGDRDYETIQVKVDDGVITFPLEARGRTARVEGTVEKVEMTYEEALASAAHHAEERGEPFDSATVTGPTTTYRIRGIGAVIQDGPAED